MSAAHSSGSVGTCREDVVMTREAGHRGRDGLERATRRPTSPCTRRQPRRGNERVSGAGRVDGLALRQRRHEVGRGSPSRLRR